VPTTAKSVDSYLAGLPAAPRKVLSTVRDTVLKSLPKGYEEMLHGKYIVYVVPLSRLPKTYNGQALWYVALGAHKSYYTLYMMVPYGDAKELALLQDGFKRAGKKLDMGKSCIHFKKLEDLPLDVIAESVARVPMENYARMYESVKRK
jgi:hypothetical protein